MRYYTERMRAGEFDDALYDVAGDDGFVQDYPNPTIPACPDCDGPALPEGDGYAYCPACELLFTSADQVQP